jgi:hypothetical protein
MSVSPSPAGETTGSGANCQPYWGIGLPSLGPRWARSPSSRSCTAGTSTWNRSCSSPPPEKFTIPQALTQFIDAYGGPVWNVQLAAASLTAIPVLVVFVIAQRQFIEGFAHTGLKG